MRKNSWLNFVIFILIVVLAIPFILFILLFALIFPGFRRGIKVFTGRSTPRKPEPEEEEPVRRAEFEPFPEGEVIDVTAQEIKSETISE